MFRKLVLLTALALVCGRPQSDGERVEFVPDDRCSDTDILLIPHESNCSQFYYCDNGQRFAEPTNCGPGTVFNAQEQVCDWPENVKCSDNHGGINPEGESGDSNSGEAPEDNNASEGAGDKNSGDIDYECPVY